MTCKWFKVLPSPVNVLLFPISILTSYYIIFHCQSSHWLQELRLSITVKKSSQRAGFALGFAHQTPGIISGTAGFPQCCWKWHWELTGSTFWAPLSVSHLTENVLNKWLDMVHVPKWKTFTKNTNAPDLCINFCMIQILMGHFHNVIFSLYLSIQYIPIQG